MLNNIVIMGRLVKDPEMRTTTGGVEVSTFTVAVDRNYKQNGETLTDFINCQAWRQTAVLVNKYFAKGRMIAVQGRLQSRNFEDKNGNKRTAWEVIADNVNFCGDKQQQKQDVPVKTDQTDITVDDDDDSLPF